MQAEAQLSSVDAQGFNGAGLVKESEERFYILTGLDRAKTFNEEVEQLVIPEAKPLDEYLTMALGREDVKNRELAIEQADRKVSLAKGGHLPTLDLSSNFYVSKSGGTSSSRASDWDIGLTLNFPLFEGGKTQAFVSEAVGARQEATYILSDYQKSVKLDVATKYEAYRRYKDQISAYDQALLKAKNSYIETTKDYRLGLVSNLDVLGSLNLYLDSKRNAEKTKIQAIMNYKILEATAGILP